MNVNRDNAYIGRDIALRWPRPRISGRSDWSEIRDFGRSVPSPDAALGDGDGAARHPYHRCRLGFTLIEIVLAVGISALVLATITGLFFSELRLRARAEEIAAETTPVDRAITVIKQDLMNIVPAGVLAGAMGTDATATGMMEAPTLEIYTANGVLSADAPFGDVQKIDYSLQAPTNRNNNTGRDLCRGVTRNLLATSPMAPDQQALLQDVQNLQFSYYDGTNWNDTWSTSLSNIPVAIKVQIDFAAIRGQAQTRPSVQFLVPVVAWANTNSTTNLTSN